MSPLIKARIAVRLLLLQARWDPSRMQAAGFAFALEPWLAVCWAAEPAAFAAARRRHLEYFNTHPAAAWLEAGIVCRQEAAASVLAGSARDAAIAKIVSQKKALGASLAGLYDSFFWGALRPASALAGILAAQAAYRFGWPRPLAWAVTVVLLAYNIPGAIARWVGLSRGLAEGDRAALSLTKLPAQAWILGLRRATVVAAVLAFGAGAAQLGGRDRLTAGCTFAAGLILTWRGVPPLAQLGFAGLGGMAASAAGLL